MSNKLHYSELNDKQIYHEIIKRFAFIEYSEEYFSMAEIFEEGWATLNKVARAQAEKWIIDGITGKNLKGLIYRNEKDGTYVYKRITNDKYREG